MKKILLLITSLQEFIQSLINAGYFNNRLNMEKSLQPILIIV
ncbi:MAG TPA: hypothetical protein VK498_12260 [Ferruginibacter sp.]|nr:hypothetical protein [Ferruginibacter sp.]